MAAELLNCTNPVVLVLDLTFRRHSCRPLLSEMMRGGWLCAILQRLFLCTTTLIVVMVVDVIFELKMIERKPTYWFVIEVSEEDDWNPRNLRLK